MNIPGSAWFNEGQSPPQVKAAPAAILIAIVPPLKVLMLMLMLMLVLVLLLVECRDGGTARRALIV